MAEANNKIKQVFQKTKNFRLIIAVLLFGTASLLLTIYWLFAPYKTVDYDGEYKMQSDVVTQGQMTAYQVKYCKYTDKKPELSKYFVDGIVFKAEEARSEFVKGCHTSLISLKIPSTLPPGRYQLRTVATYKLNPIRTKDNTNYTGWFTVVRSDLGAYGGEDVGTVGPIGPQGATGAAGAVGPAGINGTDWRKK